jgi:hypothetical protein
MPNSGHSSGSVHRRLGCAVGPAAAVLCTRNLFLSRKASPPGPSSVRKMGTSRGRMAAAAWAAAHACQGFACRVSVTVPEAPQAQREQSQGGVTMPRRRRSVGPGERRQAPR